LLVNIVNIFWIFPQVHHLFNLFRRSILIRLFTATFVCSLPVLLNPLVMRLPALFVPYWFVMVGVVTPLSWLWYQARREKIMEIKGLQKALNRSKADIGFLRSQINPHFLFNTLNTLYGTALQEDAGRTATGIQKLGDTMRFMLHDNHQDFIPMQREIEYLQHYIDIQQLRIQSSPHINIQNNIRDAQCHHVIAPMLLIPLVENAFKHGISLVEKSWIQVKLDCDATTIRFEVRNSMHLQQPGGPEKERSGTGINNVKERLHLVYPSRHQFICHGDGHTFYTELLIQP
jgi:two-component system LytT family sensor kinase